MTKRCGHCREVKPLDGFHRKEGGRHGWCKVCRSKAAHDRRLVVDRIKLEAGCIDCGYAEHPAALQFDHVRGEKRGDIAAMRRGGASMVRILAEIDKCEVVCANCHAVRTVERGDHRKPTIKQLATAA